jgi:hypothetical protein
MKMIGLAALCVVAGAAHAGVIGDRATLNTILGSDLLLEDFESYVVDFGRAEMLGTYTLDASTITSDGQGPGLVEVGATYHDPDQVDLQWNGDQYFGLNTKTLLTSSPAGRIWITYDEPVVAMGADLLGFQGYPWTGQMSVYAPGGALLGTVALDIFTGGSERFFAGWEDAGGIAQVRIESSSYSWSPIIDDHGYGVPAPGVLAMLSVGGLAMGRRKR